MFDTLSNLKNETLEDLRSAINRFKHPVLGKRLREVSMAILNLPTNDANEVFGGIDSCKLRSSMTLFDRASSNDVFARVLNKYFNGQPDKRTINMIKL